MEHVPKVVNPLTVAYGKSGKPRLVLDCRHINPELFKYRCCFEDQSVARQMFGAGDFLFSFDIRSAYHHIMIYPEHTTYLGFSWPSENETRYFVFRTLPFGISTAGYIFTKLLRVVVTKWRTNGSRIVMFLDDGLGGARTFETALQLSDYMHKDLSEFGFIVAEDKCIWTPCQLITWLGYNWDTLKGTLSVTEDRIERSMLLIEDLLMEIISGQLLFPVRKIACLVGQLISMQSAVGKVARFRTRSLYSCVTSRASWTAPVMVSSQALDEIDFWRENIRALNGAELSYHHLYVESAQKAQTFVFCDASGAGFGGYIENNEDSDVIGCWSDTECGLSSTWRELEAVHRVLNSSLERLKGQRVLVHTDNKNVASILNIGSKKAHLQSIAVSVDNVCKQNKIHLDLKWVPRKENIEADFLSRCTDSDDWSVKTHVFDTLNRLWGPYSCDLFACNYNTKCNRFFSKYWCPGTAGVNAFNCNWARENGWLVPPPRLVTQCLSKIMNERCKCTLLVPIWRSSPYWPVLFPESNKRAKFIHDTVLFPPGRLTVRGKGLNGIFDGRELKFGFIALRFEGARYMEIDK